jgi:hypothetical protein
MSVAGEESIGQGSAPALTDLAARAPRVSLRIPVLFYFAGASAKGQSVDISESGILAVFDQRLDNWLTGQLSIMVGEGHISVEARVSRVDGRAAALIFRGMSDKNRAIIQSLTKDATAGLGG